MFMSFQKISQALGKAVSVKDAFFNYVSLLINTIGTNGAQNNTFLDSSSNNYTITRNGTPTQGTFTPFSQTGWSNFFNGSTTSLRMAANSAFDQNAGSFSVECFVYPATIQATTGLFIYGAQGNTGLLMLAYGYTTGLFKIDQGAGGGVKITSSNTYPANAWYHVAYTYDGSTLKLFVNGILQGSAANAALNPRIAGPAVAIGEFAGASYFNGYISNFRICRAAIPTAYQTASTTVGATIYTPSTTPLTTTSQGASNVTFLTCQNNRFIDNASALTFTLFGTPSVQAFSPFAANVAYSTSNIGGSGYFNGTGDFLTVGATAPTLNFGTGDFTVECWIYPTADASIQKIYDFRSTAGAVGFNLQRQSGSVIAFQNSVNVVTTSSNAAPLNAWTHIVASRVSGNSRLFINGVLQGTAVADTATYVNGTNRPVIGVRGTNTTLDDFTGYITTAKVVVGSGVTSVTLPTSPSTSNGSNVYLGFTNAGIYDASTKNTLLTVGNASVSTAQAKFSPTSIAFDGSGDYVPTTPVTVVNAINNANCTLEMWVYSSNSSASLKCLIDTRTALGASTGYGVYQTGNNVVVYGGPLRGNAVASLNGNTWTHLAVTRAGATNYVFLNGTLFNTFSYGNTLTSGNVTIGSDVAASNAFTGFIEEVRITNGIARYTTNFSVPTTVFPVQ